MKKLVSVLVILFIWVVFLFQLEGIIDTSSWVLSKENGVKSIFTGSFLHGSYSHIVGNTSGLLVGFALLNKFFKNSFYIVLALGLICPYIATYFLFEQSVLGISGLTYTMIWFLTASTLFNKKLWYVGLTLALFYSNGLIYATPFKEDVAWVTHLFGVLTGLILAVHNGMYRRKDLSGHTELHKAG